RRRETRNLPASLRRRSRSTSVCSATHQPAVAPTSSRAASPASRARPPNRVTVAHVIVLGSSCASVQMSDKKHYVKLGQAADRCPSVPCPPFFTSGSALPRP